LHGQDFVTLERVTGRSFNLGISRACADLVATDWSLQKVLQEAEMVGKHVWINASSVDDLKSSVSNFLEARRNMPFATSACLLLLRADALPKGFLQGWNRILTVQKGGRVSSYMFDGEVVDDTARRMVQVYYYASQANPRSALSEGDKDTTEAFHYLWNNFGEGNPEADVTDQSTMLSAVTVNGRLLMQMSGRVAGAPATCLFDSGAEANVISKVFAERQGVSIQPSKSTVELEDRHVVDQVGSARVFVQFGAFHKAVPCLVLEQLVGGVDFIFGDPFLRSHQAVLDYGKSRVRLKKGNRKITVLQQKLSRDKIADGGAPKLFLAMQVKRHLRKGHQVMLGVVSETKEDVSVTETKPWVSNLQKEFADVFQDPLPPGLPPERDFGHTIPTEPGHVPPFRPMYRLSPLELRETKEQLARFIERGIIEPSKSPYGAPILFVPKPNGRGLRLCVDFRALNSLTRRTGTLFRGLTICLMRLQKHRYSQPSISPQGIIRFESMKRTHLKPLSGPRLVTINLKF
jgi:hypothetical protein